MTIDLTSNSLVDSANSTGLWNTVSGQIQAAVAASSTTGREIDFGDGSDGAFSDGPVQSGITVSGTSITINTSEKSEFKFSSFTLSAGFTVNVTGSSLLVIRVLGVTTIAGTIQLNGLVGTGNGLTGAGGQTLGAITGGSGVASGGDGGNAGSVSPVTSGVDGSPASGNSRGGSFFANQLGSTNERGGGGGCNGDNAGAFDATSGVFAGAAAGACGSNRTAVAASFDALFHAGGGGGGGGACSGGTCAAIVGGGAGGGSGGGFHFASLGAITFTGTIEAKGGNGGTNDADDASGVDCGGGGGGGSGGSVWVQTLLTFTGGGSIDTTAGTGGTSASCGAAYDGGNGSRGVFRADTATGANTTTKVPENVDDNTQPVGIATGQTYTIYSKGFDFSTSFVDYTSAAFTQGCGANGTLTVGFEGSNDNVNFENYVGVAGISGLSGYPYIRLKTVITTTGANPPCLTALSMDYADSVLSDLEVSGGMIFCGSLRQASGRTPWGMIFDLLPFLILFLFRTRLVSLISRRPSNGISKHRIYG